LDFPVIAEIQENPPGLLYKRVGTIGVSYAVAMQGLGFDGVRRFFVDSTEEVLYNSLP
jgi:hypothetical protein